MSMVGDKDHKNFVSEHGTHFYITLGPSHSQQEGVVIWKWYWENNTLKFQQFNQGTNYSNTCFQ